MMAPALSDQELLRARAEQLARSLLALPVPAALRLNRNRRIALSIRGRPAARTLSLHVELLTDDDCCAALPAWVRSGGRAQHDRIQAALHRLGERWRQRAAQAPLPTAPDLPVLGGPLDLASAFATVHERWFADLPRPAVRWSRNTRGGLRHIRFGAYHRPRRGGEPAVVSLHPRLDRPWVARPFIDHVLHHELCHHRQACCPLPGETPHSARFRAWEREFPDLAAARVWERAMIRRILADG